MTFEEWADTYDVDSAIKQFGLSDNMVFIVKPHKYVMAVCGNWRGSEPLAGHIQTIEEAIEKLRQAVRHNFRTEEIITDC